MKLSGLTQQTFIISQFLWVRSPEAAELGVKDTESLGRLQCRCGPGCSHLKTCLRLKEPFPTSAGCGYHVGHCEGLLRCSSSLPPGPVIRETKPPCLYNPVSAVTGHRFCHMQLWYSVREEWVRDWAAGSGTTWAGWEAAVGPQVRGMSINSEKCCQSDRYHRLGGRKILFPLLCFFQFLSLLPLSIFFSPEKSRSPLPDSPPNRGSPLLSLSLFS